MGTQASGFFNSNSSIPALSKNIIPVRVSLASLKLYSMRDTTLQFTSVWWRQWRCAWSQSLAALRIFGACSEGWESYAADRVRTFAQLQESDRLWSPIVGWSPAWSRYPDDRRGWGITREPDLNLLRCQQFLAALQTFATVSEESGFYALHVPTVETTSAPPLPSPSEVLQSPQGKERAFPLIDVSLVQTKGRAS